MEGSAIGQLPGRLCTPKSPCMAPSADALPVRLVLLIEGNDPNLADWVNGLLACHEALECSVRLICNGS